MPAGSRGEVVIKGEVGVYHCWNRCVQRAFLCGTDPVTGRDYEYRREWIQQTEQLLARLFAVEVAFHAELFKDFDNGSARTRRRLPKLARHFPIVGSAN